MFFWYKITANNYNEHNNGPKKVINNATFFGPLPMLCLIRSIL